MHLLFQTTINWHKILQYHLEVSKFNETQSSLPLIISEKQSTLKWSLYAQPTMIISICPVICCPRSLLFCLADYSQYCIPSKHQYRNLPHTYSLEIAFSRLHLVSPVHCYINIFLLFVIHHLSLCRFVFIS